MSASACWIFRPELRHGEPQECPGGPRWALEAMCPDMLQDAPGGSEWAQEAPTLFQHVPRSSQDGPRSALQAPRIPEHATRQGQKAPGGATRFDKPQDTLKG